MKKTLIALVLTTASVWAAPEGNVYSTIADPTWHVTRIGSRWVIEDSKGFFVGYYVPRPSAPTAAAASAPVTTAVSQTTAASGQAASQANSESANYSNGAYGYGYNGYSGYGYNGYGNNGFYGHNYYNPNPNCQHQSQHQEPPLQPGRDKYDIPTGTPWNPLVR